MLKLKGVKKSYKIGNQKLTVLKDISFDIAKGEVVALLGESGSGKTTLMQIVGLLDKADSGSLLIDGIECINLNEAKMSKLRGSEIGFVFQFHNLMGEFSLLENVMMPLLINGSSKMEALKKSENLIEMVGLSARKDHKTSELSGGEKQRVAIARSLVIKPKILLADEPTGNLDPGNADNVIKLILEASSELKQTTLIVTHSEHVASKAMRRLYMESGLVRVE